MIPLFIMIFYSPEFYHNRLEMKMSKIEHLKMLRFMDYDQI